MKAAAVVMVAVPKLIGPKWLALCLRAVLFLSSKAISETDETDGGGIGQDVGPSK